MSLHPQPTLPHPKTQCQEYLSCYWPNLDETLKVASWEHLEQIPTKSDKALVNSNQTRSLTLAQLFLIQAWCYTKVKCNENGKCKYKKRGDCNKHCEKYPEGKKIQVMGYCSNNDIRIIPIFSCNKQLKKWRWHFACLFFSAVNFALCNTCTLQHLKFATLALTLVTLVTTVTWVTLVAFVTVVTIVTIVTF